MRLNRICTPACVFTFRSLNFTVSERTGSSAKAPGTTHTEASNIAAERTRWLAFFMMISSVSSWNPHSGLRARFANSLQASVVTLEIGGREILSEFLGGCDVFYQLGRFRDRSPGGN